MHDLTNFLKRRLREWNLFKRSALLEVLAALIGSFMLILQHMYLLS